LGKRLWLQVMKWEGMFNRMMQRRQLMQQFAASRNAEKHLSAPGSLIDTSGLIFKPARVIPPSPSILTPEARRASVIISIDTLPMPGVQRFSPVVSPQARAQGATIFKQFRESIGFILLAAAVIAVYMIVPLMTTLIPILPGIWGRLLVALEILGLVELVICRILVVTVQQRPA
jgi:hypothetical protein